MKNNSRLIPDFDPNNLVYVLLETVLLLVSIVSSGIIIALLSSMMITPKWVASGWPSFHGYPKNIEFAAISLILLSVPVISFLMHYLKSMPIKITFTLLLLLTAVAIMAGRIEIAGQAQWIMCASTSVVLVTLVHYSLNHAAGGQYGCDDRLPPALIALLSILTLLMAGLLIAEYPLVLVILTGHDLSVIDSFHYGEVFTGAMDFLRGGIPFVTFFWPHGLEDIGLTALAFKISSRMDLSMMFMAEASRMIIGFIAVALMSIGLRMKHFVIPILFAIAYFNPVIVYYSSVLIFVSFSFLIMSKARRWHHYALSGLCIFAAHLYRIEVGVYGLFSVLTILILRLISAALKDRAELKMNVLHLLFFVSGIVTAAFAAYVILGWPGYEWYHTVFSILPKHHADSTGFPFPLPLVNTMNYDFYRKLGVRDTQYAIFSVITAIGMFAVAWKVLFKHSAIKLSQEGTFVLLLILYTVFSLKSAFGRSDGGHIQWYGNVVYFITVLIIVSLVVSLTLRKWLKVAIIFALLAFFNVSTGQLNNPLSVISGMQHADMSFINDIVEKSPDQCSNGVLSRVLLRSNPDYDWAVCETRKLFELYKIGKRQLLIAHSAALLYPSLGYELPSKYYLLGGAITEEMQRELISELERADISAVLYVRGYRGLQQYDIPDAVRVPVYYEWLINRFDFSRPMETPFGMVVFKSGYRTL